MSNPNIPNLTPLVAINLAQTIPLLLAITALEELSLAHIINAEAEKLQLVSGTLPGGTTLSPPVVSLSNLLDVDSSVQGTLRDVIKKEMLLEFQFENIVEMIPVIPPSICGCQIAFAIHRGAGAASTTTLDGVPIAGTVDFTGSFCPGCSPSGNSFIFVFNPTGPGGTSTFTATTFNVPHCPGGAVTITGQGTLTGGLATTLGSNVMYTLIFTPSTPTTTTIELILTGNGHVFTATVTTSIGGGEFTIANCP